MATASTATTKNIARFLNAVRQERTVNAYLYGSYAKGTANDWSDIDLAIVSADFSTDLFEEQVRLL